MDAPDALTAFVAARFAELRAAQGWSLEELASRADLHRTSLGLIERGKRGMTLATAARLASALGTSLGAVVLEGEASNQRDPGPSGTALGATSGTTV